MLQVLRLPRKASLRCSKCCAFHAKNRWHPNASLVAGLPRTSVKVLHVLRLPRKTNLRCSKCCACHAKRAGDAPSVALATQNEPEVLQVPATQNEAAPKRITRRQTSADLCEGAPSLTENIGRKELTRSVIKCYILVLMKATQIDMNISESFLNFVIFDVEIFECPISFSNGWAAQLLWSKPKIRVAEFLESFSTRWLVDFSEN